MAARPPAPRSVRVLGWTALLAGLPLAGGGAWLWLAGPLHGTSAFPAFAWCASIPLLGAACLRGWGALRLPWLVAHGTLVACLLWIDLRAGRPEIPWAALSAYALTYALAAWLLCSPRARAFFRAPQASGLRR